MQDDTIDLSLPKFATIQLVPAQLPIVPGETSQLKILITNLSDQEDYFELTLQGLPAGWLPLPALSLRLDKGDSQELLIKVQIPATPQVQPGAYHFTARLEGRNSPGQAAETQGMLIVGIMTGSPRTGLLIQQAPATITPGERAPLTFLVINLGNTEDTFRVSISGVPINWLSEPILFAHLAPGAQASLTFNVFPPRSADCRAGRHSLLIQVFSQQSAEELVRTEHLLTVTGFEQFASSLEPQQIENGQKSTLIVQNQGNTLENFHIAIDNQADLIVEPALAPILRLQPGETGQHKFTLRLAKRPLRGLIGRDSRLPFTVEIQTSDGESQQQIGEVISRAPVPVWVLPAILMICLMLTCLALYLMLRRPVKIDYQATQQALAAYQTAQAMIAYQTALAVTTASLYPPSPTAPPPTFTPTETPTFTPIAPTYTPLPTITSLPPTATPTITPVPFPVPNQGSIAFESNRDGPRNLYVFNTSIQATTRLTTNAWVDTMPAWSPSGQWLAFASNRTGNYDIFVMRPDGSAVTNLTNSTGDDYSPTWSPDGMWIAYTSNRDGNQEIYKFRADGSAIQNLTNNPAEDYYPNWLKFGQIAFTTNRDGNQEIYLMDSEGGYQSNQTYSPANDFYPVGSHNGFWIAFTSNREGNQEIFVMNSDGSNPVNLTNNPAEDNQPSWSADDAWIAFVTNRTGSPEIFVMRGNGTDPYNLTNQPGQEQYPAWN